MSACNFTDKNRRKVENLRISLAIRVKKQEKYGDFLVRKSEVLYGTENQAGRWEYWKEYTAYSKGKGIGQTELVRMMDLQGVSITRECLVKIERGIQHIQVQQLREIRKILETTYDELLK